MVNFIDYFNPEEKRYEYTFPDGVSKLYFRGLNEGDRAWTQNQRSMIEVDSVTKKMRMDAGSGTFKIEVVSRAMIEWEIQTKGTDGVFHRVAFETPNIRQLLANLDPLIMDEIYEIVQKNNPWLNNANKSKKDLSKQIKKLNEEKKEIENEEKKD
jgi:hypothetical protein